MAVVVVEVAVSVAVAPFVDAANDEDPPIVVVVVMTEVKPELAMQLPAEAGSSDDIFLPVSMRLLLASLQIK